MSSLTHKFTNYQMSKSPKGNIPPKRGISPRELGKDLDRETKNESICNIFSISETEEFVSDCSTSNYSDSRKKKIKHKKNSKPERITVKDCRSASANLDVDLMIKRRAERREGVRKTLSDGAKPLEHQTNSRKDRTIQLSRLNRTSRNKLRSIIFRSYLKNHLDQLSLDDRFPTEKISKGIMSLSQRKKNNIFANKFLIKDPDGLDSIPLYESIIKSSKLDKSLIKMLFFGNNYEPLLTPIKF